ncbi:DUF302 domain-containing protein [Ktedonobacter racemifer]|uniref:DUF302 domain-containing protein n=1 Tax=Ktedonobacter racemifer DSM 44963 TaxID=485913 RepID=D6U281_KTERA|nr:DUF302 domain-containing protein [Ktedonobacter racemifer]EFH82749.1 conserved hypothetical protein [Ktedonobacter racemifer DSM 44963]
MSPSEQQVLVDHVVVETTQSFERVTEAFEGQIGRKGHEAYQNVVTSSRTLEEFTQGIEQLLGSSEFMEFLALDHGAWFSRLVHPLKAKLYIIGNPLIAQHFEKYSAQAGLYVPIRVLLYENARGNTCLSYDRPSSLLQVCAVTEEEFVQTAADLDQKVAHLVQKAASQIR